MFETYPFLTAITSGLLSLIGALLGVLATHFLSDRRKRREELTEQKLKAYSDFINSASKIIAARRLGNIENDPQELAVLNDAKVRICICGDRSVIQELAKFWENGATLEREHEILAFTRLCMRIRESLGYKAHDLADLKISDTLFRIEPSCFSYRASKQEKASDAENVEL
ncbi:hypothetical protein NP603_01910 [Methylomonas sp. SURF-1]|uniref:Uncharacterized protein n=1 Tax=Methylomonas aurea TaxID=2952224 RepID=A0ABT1UCA5_9GAMM|nr:hypothetical protein [Methylomonas sp. SURF-1]MCQ8179852.1 hypothetical protein [Methylomonas sp. SURF-1]